MSKTNNSRKPNDILMFKRRTRRTAIDPKIPSLLRKSKDFRRELDFRAFVIEKHWNTVMDFREKKKMKRKFRANAEVDLRTYEVRQ